MNNVIILANDWGNFALDPVPYYGTDPNGCLKFNSSPRIARNKLTEISSGNMNDCNSGTPYAVVICSVGP